MAGLPGRPTYAGPLDCLRSVLRLEGVSGLYRGLVPNLMKVREK